MLQLLKVRRGRKVAVAAIGPFLEGSRRRFNGIPASVLAQPYVIGFISVLISVAAKSAVPSISTQNLGLVQSEAWFRLTGLSADLFGEEICYLSGTRQRDFVEGCVNALAFAAAMRWGPPEAGGGFDAPAAFDDALLGRDDGIASYGDAQDLWASYFEARLAGAEEQAGTL